ncbi:UDP-glucose 4-epimerase GalE [Neisseria weaveri]|uniref:UDP-glucose 4-epimerase GalE n=1 Tax=Neisseria weaveri TaxID=28091 RepID=UPI0007C9B3F9|nr:UDP-glucose 4-epimerase GalE [Neisseria weaveri]SAY51283.1 UDP-glucose 4-epimerase (galactowaldenase; UDP-galactose 4-epimerase) [Neisseria weaveri]
MAILVTGGLGFIGSHTVVSLHEAGYEVVILDNLSNASEKALPRLEQMLDRRLAFYRGDVRDRMLLQTVFAEHRIEAVIHFAGLKAVGESVREPLEYYDNNVMGSLILLEEMKRAGVFTFVFSSSATVYGLPETVPMTEQMPTGATTNPYATSKYMVERMLADAVTADTRWNMIILRYFNPVGAHASGMIGENPNGIPNNLLPYICQVAAGKLKHLNVFGGDYPTQDGTGVRDYIHVMDLAEGHLKALQVKSGQCGLHVYNLGRGIGCSVLEVVSAFEQTSGVHIPYVISPRRDGDIASYYADTVKATAELGWTAKRDLHEIMRDAWNWQSKNPNGYE